ncbi:hypothetical protein IM316_12775 [Enterobacter cloacae complex sp. S4]|uniref:Inner membrane protein n=1 Tax=Enterobacter roggenkampii TaxID=1812935 RepID=A0AAX1WEK4_9ENTR|nr:MULTISPECIES: hypothetical protein [Enterobacter cloacae complex]CAE6252402.1 hypothetical protein AI2705V1_2122 [Enterobacter cloacae]EHF8255260.1 hypothetical protein [Enterobacter roggenkampii]ELD8599950.1 hypothetical protein [Enterobacter roggenkampii]KTJ25597.1 hypothetical protein ASU87_05220 [Enterobacter roggenkampii]MBE4868221.1 hypothetical protein [Enterobacter cloacae complex sp. S4]
MSFVSLLTGRVFQDLLQHGKEIEETIAHRDIRIRLLNHSTPELERYFSRPLSELPRQNPYPVAFLLPLFLVAFALNLLPFLSALQGLSPLHHALSFFVPSLTMTGALIVISVLLARGKTSGLLGFRALLIILLITTLVQVLHVMLSHDGSLWPHVIASFALLLCRVVMNGSGFVLFTLYCRTQRLARLAREMRLKSR